jgi:hypothetical protein
MAKKKRTIKKVTRKKTVAKKTVKKATKKKPAKKRPSAPKKKATKKPLPAKRKATAAKKGVAKRKKAKGTAKSLGRPRITGEAVLDQFFKKDYEARQVFDFLNVKTVKDLETYGPDEIVEKLTSPVVRTVIRIRKALAMNNRCLKDDRQFALEFKQMLVDQS